MEIGFVMFRSTAVLFTVLAFAGLSSAQLPSFNVFGGYSYMSADFNSGGRTNLNGWNASAEGKVLPFIGLVADFSGHYGSVGSSGSAVCPFPGIGGCSFTIGANVSEHNFLFGPRASVTIGKFRPFAHALIGAGHLNESAAGLSNSDTSFAYAIGGGIDY